MLWEIEDQGQQVSLWLIPSWQKEAHLSFTVREAPSGVPLIHAEGQRAVRS